MTEESKPVSADAGKLASYIERIERLEEERKELGADVREIFAEAKGNGYDVKVMRQILRLRILAFAWALSQRSFRACISAAIFAYCLPCSHRSHAPYASHCPP